jgi:hypothetical protein
MAFGERAAEHGEILAEHKTRRPFTVPEPVTTPSPGIWFLHAEIDAVMLDIHVELLEAAFIEQDTSSRSRAVRRPLACCASMRFSPAAHARGLALCFQLLDNRHLGHVRIFALWCRSAMLLLSSRDKKCKCEFAKLQIDILQNREREWLEATGSS